MYHSSGLELWLDNEEIWRNVFKCLRLVPDIYHTFDNHFEVHAEELRSYLVQRDRPVTVALVKVYLKVRDCKRYKEGILLDKV